MSFYNESRGRDIDPTPVVGVVGLIDDLTRSPPPVRSCTTATRSCCSVTPKPSSAARSGRRSHGLRGGLPPAADLDVAAALHDFVRELVVGARGRAACTTCPTAGSRSRSPRWPSPGDCGFDVSLTTRAGARARVVLGVGVARRGRRSTPTVADALVERARAAGVPAAATSAPPAATASSPTAPSPSPSPTPPTPGATPSPRPRLRPEHLELTCACDGRTRDVRKVAGGVGVDDRVYGRMTW